MQDDNELLHHCFPLYLAQNMLEWYRSRNVARQKTKDTRLIAGQAQPPIFFCSSQCNRGVLDRAPDLGNEGCVFEPDTGSHNLW